MDELERLKREYQTVPVPDQLGLLVESTLRRQNQKMKRSRVFRDSIIAAAAMLSILVAVVNLSPASASAMERIPVLKNLVRIVTFARLSYQEGGRGAEVGVPEIRGLQNEELAALLNEEYVKRNTELFGKFVEGYGEDEWNPLFLMTNFNVKTSTDEIFVVENTVVEIGASAKESVRYDNIDLRNQMIITLPSLFKDDGYVEIISENVKTQMREKANPEEGTVYFIKGEPPVDDGFDKIDPEQIFYINSDSELVIVFNEYDVAPGCMGIVEFVIPTEVIQDLLVSNAYVK